MKHPLLPELSVRARAARTLLIALAGLPLVGAAQTAPTTRARPGDADQTVTLDPFQVSTNKDTSYGALNSNSVTKFNIALDKTPISADIFTEAFMQDTDSLSVEGMFNSFGAGAGTMWATPAFGSITNQPGDRVNTAQLSVRGVGAGAVRRDGFGFTGNIPIPTTTSNFDIERVEVLRGPQGLLYGAGGAGGTIVATTKQAHFSQNSGSITERIDEYGSRRALVDVNSGNDWMAARFDFLREVNKYRRLDAFDQSNGYYGQLAFHLPLHTTLRVEAQYNAFWATTGLAYAGVNLGGAAVDPRSGQQPGYLLFTNRAGAINPATGAPFSKYGAIWNGHLNWDDYASYGQGLPTLKSRTSNNIYEALFDTVWFPWLSTSVGGEFNRTVNLNVAGPSAITAPLISGNPFNDWAVNNTFAPTVTETRYKGFKAAALITKDFFHGIAKTQTGLGYTVDGRAIGTTAETYYLSDSSGSLIISPGANNLGRTPMPAQWWNIGSGPGWNGNPAVGSPIYYSTQNNQYYKLQESNPRSPAYVTPNNPLGLASLYYPGTGISGGNQDGYANRVWIQGYYISNYTSWWDDRLTTLLGYRTTQVVTHYPNTASPTQAPFTNNTYNTQSYNLGLDGKITPWLRWYASTSNTFDIPYGANDPYGNPPGPTRGTGDEVGFKFSPLDSRISGSVEYYWSSDKNQTIGSPVANIVNPTGLNGVYNGIAGKGSWDFLDVKSKGLEVILTASPTKNWRIRLTATQSDGTIGTGKTYGILYNDQFYADSSGNVTYKDGSPVLVPATPIAGLNASVNPATVAGATQPLTTAMIGDPTSAYYAWQGGAVTASGNILGTSNVGRVLQYFNKPGVGNPLTGVAGLPISKIQYAWPNPSNYPGGVVTAAAKGQSTVGYPVYRISLTNSYQLDRGWFKGLGIVAALNNAWQWRTYYYGSPDGIRRLYSQPEIGWQINLNPFYERKFGRILWRTQVNISNLTNHYVLALAPQDGSGFTNPNNITVQWVNQPRAYSWTNTLSF
jgi:outer membrane receptor for ferric coprogen and ferric-rhodotorulic acid